jgi:hypothetical protein
VTLVQLKVFAGRQLDASRLYFRGDYKQMEMRIATPAESAHALSLALPLFQSYGKSNHHGSIPA